MMLTLKKHIRLYAVSGMVTCCLITSPQAMSAMYTLKGDDTVIGELKNVPAQINETLLDIGRHYGFGYHDLKIINPGVDTWIPGEGQQILLPSQFILPNTPRKGIVLNIPEMRLYYFPETKKGEVAQIYTYPLGIGREGWATPYIKTKIVQKKKNPSWYPPESIRKEHEENGDPLPKVVGPGPDNPMGDYALKLGFNLYSIHGTNKPYGVGMRVSHGCIRLYPEDIEDLFQRVNVGTPVNIVNQPYKIGVLDGVIYLEVHPPLSEDNEHYAQNSLTEVVKFIIDATEESRYTIDWDLVKQVVADSKGVPVPVGLHLPELQLSASATASDHAPAPPSGPVSGTDPRLDLRLETELTQKQ